jgi:hypothetical protein
MLMILEYCSSSAAATRRRRALRDLGREAIAGIKFPRDREAARLARQNDPNHSLFWGLWQPGSR